MPKSRQQQAARTLVVIGALVALILTYQNCGKLTDQSGAASSASSSQNTNAQASPAASPLSSPTPVPSASPAASAYFSTIKADGPIHYWRLGETSGTTLADQGSLVANATISGSYTMQLAGALVGDLDDAIGFTTTTSVVVSKSESDPLVFSEELWFKTSTAGGDLLSYGNVAGANSTNYDRQIYMSNTGQIYFGVYTTFPYAINSANAYNNGVWHHVVGTFVNTTGPKLYVDGALVASGTAMNTNNATGFVHIGNNTCSGWPSSPTQCAFAGDLDEIAIYPTALSASQVLNHYNKGIGQ